MGFFYSRISTNVYNNQSQFWNLQLAKLEKCLIAGLSDIQIKIFASIEINLAGLKRSKTIMLEETTLILSFYTNFVSFNQIIAKNVY